jgi:TonB family protein
MERNKSVLTAMNWHWLVTDASLTALFLLLGLLLLYGTGIPHEKQGPTGLQEFLALFVGASEGGLDASMVITKVPPTYPAIARQMNIAGVVEVNVTADDNGKVTEALAINGPAMLRASAEAAIRQWKFKGSGKGKIAVTFGK